MLQNATAPGSPAPGSPAPGSPAPTADPSNPIDSYAQSRIAYHARRLRRMMGAAVADVADLEQELALDLLKALPKYDPSKASLPTFVSRVTNRRCLGLLREARRRRLSAISLDAARHDEIYQDQRQRMTGYRPNEPLDKAEVAEAVQAAVKRLPARLREIAVLLMSHTQAETARELGVSETTIHRARKRIREHFAAAGMQELLMKA